MYYIYAAMIELNDVMFSIACEASYSLHFEVTENK